MVTRYATSAGSAFVVTFGLLFLMQAMIAKGRPVTDGSAPVVIDVWVREDGPDDPPAPAKRAEPPEPPAIPPPRERIELGNETGLVIGIRQPVPPAPSGGFRHALGLVDGEAMPLVKVQPAYPAAAVTRGLEGYVVVAFTITAIGSVEDVVVVESSDRVFERAAVEAARKFRYRPRVIDGEPVELRGKQHLIRFEMAD